MEGEAGRGEGRQTEQRCSGKAPPPPQKKTNNQQIPGLLTFFWVQTVCVPAANKTPHITHSAATGRLCSAEMLHSCTQTLFLQLQ